MTATATQVRQDVVTRLKAAMGDEAGRVHDSPVDDWTPTDLPAIAVYGLTSNRRRRGPGVPTFAVTDEIAVDVIVEAADGKSAAEACEDLEDQVSLALLTDPNWVSQFEHVESVRTTRGRLEEGDAVRWSARVVFEVQYFEKWEPVVPDDLRRIHIKVDFIEPPLSPPGPDGKAEAETEIELEAA